MRMVLNKYPKIDVHGETTETVVFVVQDFIKDNYKDMYLKWAKYSENGFYGEK